MGACVNTSGSRRQRPVSLLEQLFKHPVRAPGLGGGVGEAACLYWCEWLFAGLPNPFVATRYHSLVVRPDSVPDSLIVTATASDGVVMGLRHRELAVEGVEQSSADLLGYDPPALFRPLSSVRSH